ncbi:hypothetical protein [Actinophytocola xanthii]|uniref:Peptidase inhibitor family I36 n=1 Tax=Actinophytocola xanthii TaxID=1912961 RepID=A0A1Q8CDV5_9PSEU|nr:hypothetical protein [Actinophytocola xanthii]OLF12551.1 hypothetical protein BU204_29030 [Actinophytocola xanthii]
MSRKLFARLAGITVAVAASSVALLAAPASAAPAPGVDKPIPAAPKGPYCSSGYHCVFWSALGSASHDYFNSDVNFTDDLLTNGEVVNDNIWSASNSSTGGYESHYYYDISYGGGLVFCVNPGGAVEYTELTDDLVDGNGVAQRDEASSLRLRGTTTIPCFN